jgi:hypothetical protein
VSGITTARNPSLHQGGTAGLLTAERLAELDADGRTGRYAWRAHYYDILGNCIQTVTLYPDGKLMRESSRYDLRGSVTATCTALGTGQGSQSMVTTNSFDSRGRLTLSTTSLNGSQVSYMECEYNQLGQPCSTVYGNGVSETLTYDIRGQETACETVDGYSEELFTSVLRYTDAWGGNSSPSWTGNISSWTWEQNGQSPRTYVFGYDGLDRLTSTAQYLNSTLENKFGEEDAVLANITVGPDHKNVLDFVRKIKEKMDPKGKDNIDVECGYEAGCLGYSLYQLLSACKLKCTILTPTTMHSEKGPRIKTDRRDAKLIAQCLSNGGYHAVHIPTAEDNVVKEYVRMRDDHKLALKKVKQQTNALCIRFGFLYDGTKWTGIHLKWLRALALPELVRETLNEYLATYD